MMTGESMHSAGTAGGLAHRKHSTRNHRSPSMTITGAEREQTLLSDIRSLERKLKELPYVDLRVELQDIEEIVQKAVKDLIANVEEQHEITTMLKQIERELKELDDRSKSSRRLGASSRKRDGVGYLSPEDEHKRTTKVGVLKKLQQLRGKNDEQKVMISRFLTNICRQGKKGELEEKVS